MPLELDGVTIVFEVFNFLVLVWLLNRFVFTRVLETVKARAEQKEQLLHEIAAERDEATRLREELETRLHRIEEAAAGIMAKAQDNMEAERQSLLQETQAEIERLLTEAQDDADGIRQHAADEFHTELLELVLKISGQIIGQTAPGELHDVLVKQLTDRIWELGRSEMRQVEIIRRSIQDRSPTVHVESARPLSPEQKGQIIRTFSALADHNVELELKTEEALVMGVRVRLGDMIVDNSIATQLNDLRETVSKSLAQRAVHD